MASLAVFVLSGLLIALALDVPPVCWLLASVVFLLPAVFFRKRTFSRLLVFLFIACLFMGYGAFRNRPKSVSFPDSGVLTGTVSREASYQPEKNRTTLVLSDYQIDDQAYKGKIYVYLYGYNQDNIFRYGQTISVTDADLWLPEGQTNPYGFDFRQYLRMKGIDLCASGAVSDTDIIGEDVSLQSVLFGIRRTIGGWIDDIYPEQADIMRALLLGDKASLSDETYDDFKDSGIAHLISLSGLHVSLIALLIETLLMLCMLPKRARYVLTCLLLAVYAMMTGASASIIRAVLMYAFFCMSRMFGYPSDFLTRIAAAFLIQTAVNPLIIRDTGFQLSYASVLSLALISDLLSRCINRRRMKKVFARALESAASGAAIQMGTLPLLSNLFYSVPVLSIPVNMIAIPFGLLTIYAGALSMILYPIWKGGARLIALLPETIWSAIRAMAHFVAGLPFAMISSRKWPLFFVIAYFICLFLVSPYHEPVRRIRIRYLVLLPVIALLGMYMPLHINHGLQVMFLEAGYADSAVVDAKGSAYVIDCGKDNDICADYLTASGANVQGIFLSHPDIDHAGGAVEILERYEDAFVYLPECWERMDVRDELQEALQNANIVYLSRGDEVDLADGIFAKVLWPEEGFTPKSDNDGSLVLNICYNETSVMFTGDITDKYDKMLLSDCDILKVAHHGSKYATTKEFLSAATPEIAVISVDGNGYGHPTPDVLSRLSEAGAAVYRTDESGAITIDVDRMGNVQISTFLP